MQRRPPPRTQGSSASRSRPPISASYPPKGAKEPRWHEVRLLVLRSASPTVNGFCVILQTQPKRLGSRPGPSRFPIVEDNYDRDSDDGKSEHTVDRELWEQVARVKAAVAEATARDTGTPTTEAASDGSTVRQADGSLDLLYPTRPNTPIVASRAIYGGNAIPRRSVSSKPAGPQLPPPPPLADALKVAFAGYIKYPILAAAFVNPSTSPALSTSRSKGHVADGGIGVPKVLARPASRGAAVNTGVVSLGTIRQVPIAITFAPSHGECNVGVSVEDAEKGIGLLDGGKRLDEEPGVIPPEFRAKGKVGRIVIEVRVVSLYWCFLHANHGLLQWPGYKTYTAAVDLLVDEAPGAAYVLRKDFAAQIAEVVLRFATVRLPCFLPRSRKLTFTRTECALPRIRRRARRSGWFHREDDVGTQGAATKAGPSTSGRRFGAGGEG
uniref:Uncharacterized protein n=1 Tax=Mycena chlorophos TaxID=658473 RepID=A0ABQ0LMY1_MYCCL|nr:predicted protein [Mycena chlorophos]